MFTWLHNLFSCYLRQCLPKNIKEAHIKNYELLLKIPYPFIYQVLRFLKNNIYCKFKLLNDLISCDTLKKNNRFILIYHLLSIKFNARLKIYIEVKETSNIFSVANLYKSSNWLEREVWDLFGIFFKNHPNLKRILTDYTYTWNPLKKNFPLTGYTELFYNDSNQKLNYTIVELMQEYREFGPKLN